MSDSIRSKLLELIGDLRSQKALVEKHYKAELEKVDDDLQSVQRTLDLMSGPDTVPSSLLELSLTDTSLIANALSQKDALKVIADQNGGLINLTKAADLLIRTGRAKGKRRNLVASLWAYLHDDEEWEKVSKGNYRLKRKVGASPKFLPK